MMNALKVSTPSDREVLMTRTFHAPRELVWETMTDPELIKRWLFGPTGWIMTACDDERKVGGSFRWAWRGPDGGDLVMTGVYREITAPERCVRTEIFSMGSGPAMGDQLATMQLAEEGSKTLLTLTLLYDSKEARDGAVASGMERGVAASYDKLEEVLAT